MFNGSKYVFENNTVLSYTIVLKAWQPHNWQQIVFFMYFREDR